MRRRERGEGVPPCGYGLLGLCCSSCLLGPCRISPFEKDSEKGQCGEGPDRIVAKNLLRLVGGEILEGLGSLRRAIERFSSLGPETHARRRASSGFRSRIIEKYALSPKTTGKALGRYFSIEAENLLSPVSRKRSILKNLCPERIFPSLYQQAFPPDPLMGYLIDSIHSGSRESSDVEEILWRCLQISTIRIVCEEIERDMKGLTDLEGPDQIEALDTLAGVSSDLSPVIITVQDERYGSKEWIDGVVQKLKESVKGEVPTLSIKSAGFLLEIGRRLYEKWSIPVAGMKTTTLISSPRATWTLGALALGFNVLSSPGLPIHGSERVEKFFTETLRKRFGNVYLLS
ncbi:MAG: hypothetical protein HXY46_07595 [Syntrophaceae bacterium]|nr:hypothetical protein [Syntrophaceae bacterium]